MTRKLQDYIKESAAWISAPAVGDDFAINIREECLVESHIVDLVEDGVVLAADDKMMQILESYGMLENDSRESVARAITHRILNQRLDLLSKYGPDKVSDAIDDVAAFVGSVEEIGSSDISGWVRQVERTLSDGIDEQGVAEAMFPGSAIGDKLRAMKSDLGRDSDFNKNLMYTSPFLGASSGVGTALGIASVKGSSVLFAPAIAGGAAVGIATALGGFLTYKGLNWLAQKLFGTKEEALEFAKAHLKAALARQEQFEFQGKTYPVKIYRRQDAMLLLSKINNLEIELFGTTSTDLHDTVKKSVAEGSEWETRHDEFVTVGDRATPEQINKIVSALDVAAKQVIGKRGFLNQIFGKQSNADLARMAHGAETLAKHIQRNRNAKPGTDERKELGQHLVYAVSLLKRISGEQGVAEGSQELRRIQELAGVPVQAPAITEAGVKNWIDDLYYLFNETYAVPADLEDDEYLEAVEEFLRDEGVDPSKIEDIGELFIDRRDQEEDADHDYANQLDAEQYDDENTMEDIADEAKYQGREVPLGKPMAGDVAKSKVYVKGPKGNVVKVNFGDKKMRIKKSNPKRRKSFRARHHCENPGPRWKARYWSCRKW